MSPPTQEQPRRFSRRVPTADDWYPTAADGTVRASVLLQPEETPGLWWVRVCVWGEDDCGRERDARALSRAEAEALYDRLVRWLAGLAVVEQRALRALGFQDA